MCKKSSYSCLYIGRVIYPDISSIKVLDMSCYMLRLFQVILVSNRYLCGTRFFKVLILGRQRGVCFVPIGKC